MNTKTIISVLLITLGIVVLAYSGLSFTTPGKPIDFLGLHIATTNSHFISAGGGRAGAGWRHRAAARQTQECLMNEADSSACRHCSETAYGL